MNKYELLASMAISQLITAGAFLPVDIKHEAVEYAKNGIAHLRALSSYDPLSYATPLADDAVIEYIKAKVVGQSITGNSPFNAAAQFWTKKAAEEYRSLV